LVKAKAGVRLRHPATPSENDIDLLFTASSHADDNSTFKLTPTTPYLSICTAMYATKKVIVGSGYAILGKDRPVALLTLAESTKGEFALIFSMSHAIADGRTYYEILQMLQPGADVRKLSSTRIMAFSKNMRDMVGAKELDWADSAGVTAMYTFSMMFNKPAKCVAFHLDAERLALAKADGAKEGGVPYVSTNDVLTSGFFNECDARIGMMGMDCRGRVEGIEKDMAGNYVTALTMDPDTFGTPADIKKMLASTPFQTTKRPLPGFCSWLCGRESAKFAMVTNWSSFAGGLIQLEGCELVIHLPVQNPAYCVYDLMIPFASGVGKVGIICWTVSSDEEGLRKALPVGECVSKELFP
jgi:hypothetical protein